MGTLANSKDPDEMEHYVCEGKNNLQKKKYNILLEIITFDPLIYTMDHPDLTVSNFMENSIGPKRVKGYSLHLILKRML